MTRFFKIQCVATKARQEKPQQKYKTERIKLLNAWPGTTCNVFYRPPGGRTLKIPDSSDIASLFISGLIFFPAQK